MLARRSPRSPHAMGMDSAVFGAPRCQKRKAESQDNERLSKRMSLLNIEHGGARLYVPVESANSSSRHHPPSPRDQTPFPRTNTAARPPRDTDNMMLDDTKHKVYIYDLDDELSSSESEDDPGRLVFLSDIDKHLRANRIPPRVLPNTDGELAGMQLVLYREPTSLTVPEEQDNVRRVMMEARERIREKQRTRLGILEQQTNAPPAQRDVGNSGGGLESWPDRDYDPDAMDLS